MPHLFVFFVPVDLDLLSLTPYSNGATFLYSAPNCQVS